ncbi:SRPBCC domain-containing protein [Streptomyces sp. NPDC086787]|uniref:SRPBCC family protein n=1 Tax=Streptomyces sp. NPDC086787 TaxID=3365759 RepID=UPI0037F22F98
MRYEWGEYSFDGAVTVECPYADVLRWLVMPDLMSRWIVGLDAVTLLDSQPDVVGAHTRLDFGGGKCSPGTFHGEVVELSDQILIRCYRPGFDSDKYERTVRYDLRATGAATALRCSVQTRLLGLPAVLRRLPYRDEQVHLHRSLERLRSLAEGQQQLPLLRRIRDSGLQAQPL